MKEISKSLRNAGYEGALWASFLVPLLLGTGWPLSQWMRGKWVLLGAPLPLFWCTLALYYAFWMWLVLFLMNEYKAYPKMAVDAVLCACLFAVATALFGGDIHPALSKEGFGAAPWVVLAGTWGLVSHILVFSSRRTKGENWTAKKELDRTGKVLGL